MPPYPNNGYGGMEDMITPSGSKADFELKAFVLNFILNLLSYPVPKSGARFKIYLRRNSFKAGFYPAKILEE